MTLPPLAASGDFNAIKNLLDGGHDVNERDSYGECALHETGRHGRDQEARLVLERKADVNIMAEGNNGWTALHIASRYGKLGVVKLILEFGGDPNKLDGNEDSSLHLAVKQGHGDVVELLCQFGADPDKPAKNGKTSFELAQDKPALLSLLEKGKEASARFHASQHEKKVVQVDESLQEDESVEFASFSPADVFAVSFDECFEFPAPPSPYAEFANPDMPTMGMAETANILADVQHKQTGQAEIQSTLRSELHLWSLSMNQGLLRMESQLHERAVWFLNATSKSDRHMSHFQKQIQYLRQLTDTSTRSNAAATLALRALSRLLVMIIRSQGNALGEGVLDALIDLVGSVPVLSLYKVGQVQASGVEVDKGIEPFLEFTSVALLQGDVRGAQLLLQYALARGSLLLVLRAVHGLVASHVAEAKELQPLLSQFACIELNTLQSAYDSGHGSESKQPNGSEGKQPNLTEKATQSSAYSRSTQSNTLAMALSLLSHLAKLCDDFKVAESKLSREVPLTAYPLILDLTPECFATFESLLLLLRPKPPSSSGDELLRLRLFHMTLTILQVQIAQAVIARIDPAALKMSEALRQLVFSLHSNTLVPHELSKDAESLQASVCGLASALLVEAHDYFFSSMKDKFDFLVSAIGGNELWLDKKEKSPVYGLLENMCGKESVFGLIKMIEDGGETDGVISLMQAMVQSLEFHVFKALDQACESKQKESKQQTDKSALNIYLEILHSWQWHLLSRIAASAQDLRQKQEAQPTEAKDQTKPNEIVPSAEMHVLCRWVSVLFPAVQRILSVASRLLRSETTTIRQAQQLQTVLLSSLVSHLAWPLLNGLAALWYCHTPRAALLGLLDVPLKAAVLPLLTQLDSLIVLVSKRWPGELWPVRTTRSIQSSHPPDVMRTEEAVNLDTRVHIPGADNLEVRLDARCHLQSTQSFQIYRKATANGLEDPLTKPMTGSPESGNWEAAPIHVQGNEVFLRYRSPKSKPGDPPPSWGYCAEIVAIIKLPPFQFCTDVLATVAWLAGSHIAQMLRGAPLSSPEQAVIRHGSITLESTRESFNLFQSGVSSDIVLHKVEEGHNLQEQAESASFLQQLMSNKHGSAAESFLKAMESCVPKNDRIVLPSVRNLVRKMQRMTLAVLLKHTCLVPEAQKLAGRYENHSHHEEKEPKGATDNLEVHTTLIEIWQAAEVIALYISELKASGGDFENFALVMTKRSEFLLHSSLHPCFESTRQLRKRFTKMRLEKLKREETDQSRKYNSKVSKRTWAKVRVAFWLLVARLKSYRTLRQLLVRQASWIKVLDESPVYALIRAVSSFLLSPLDAIDLASLREGLAAQRERALMKAEAIDYTTQILSTLGSRTAMLHVLGRFVSCFHDKEKLEEDSTKRAKKSAAKKALHDSPVFMQHWLDGLSSGKRQFAEQLRVAFCGLIKVCLDRLAGLNLSHGLSPEVMASIRSGQPLSPLKDVTNQFRLVIFSLFSISWESADLEEVGKLDLLAHLAPVSVPLPVPLSADADLSRRNIEGLGVPLGARYASWIAFWLLSLENSSSMKTQALAILLQQLDLIGTSCDETSRLATLPKVEDAAKFSSEIHSRSVSQGLLDDQDGHQEDAPMYDDTKDGSQWSCWLCTVCCPPSAIICSSCGSERQKATESLSTYSLKEIQVRTAGPSIHAITFCFSDSSEITWGGSEGLLQPAFVLEQGETLTSVKCRLSGVLTQVQFVLNNGRMSPAFGVDSGHLMTFNSSVPIGALEVSPISESGSLGPLRGVKPLDTKRNSGTGLKSRRNAGSRAQWQSRESKLSLLNVSTSWFDGTRGDIGIYGLGPSRSSYISLSELHLLRVQSLSLLLSLIRHDSEIVARILSDSSWLSALIPLALEGGGLTQLYALRILSLLIPMNVSPSARVHASCSGVSINSAADLVELVLSKIAEEKFAWPLLFSASEKRRSSTLSISARHVPSPVVRRSPDVQFTVIGAGIAAFNGDYVLDGKADGVSRYRKAGVGAQETCNRSNGAWYFCRNHTGFWYKAPQNTDFPPNEGWIEKSTDMAPAPRLSTQPSVSFTAEEIHTADNFAMSFSPQYAYLLGRLLKEIEWKQTVSRELLKRLTKLPDVSDLLMNLFRGETKKFEEKAGVMEVGDMIAALVSLGGCFPKLQPGTRVQIVPPLNMNSTTASAPEVEGSMEYGIIASMEPSPFGQSFVVILDSGKYLTITGSLALRVVSDAGVDVSDLPDPEKFFHAISTFLGKSNSFKLTSNQACNLLHAIAKAASLRALSVFLRDLEANSGLELAMSTQVYTSLEATLVKEDEPSHFTAELDAVALRIDGFDASLSAEHELQAHVSNAMVDKDINLLAHTTISKPKSNLPLPSALYVAGESAVVWMTPLWQDEELALRFESSMPHDAAVDAVRGRLRFGTSISPPDPSQKCLVCLADLAPSDFLSHVCSSTIQDRGLCTESGVCLKTVLGAQGVTVACHVKLPGLNKDSKTQEILSMTIDEDVTVKLLIESQDGLSILFSVENKTEGLSKTEALPLSCLAPAPPPFLSTIFLKAGNRYMSCSSGSCSTVDGKEKTLAEQFALLPVRKGRFPNDAWFESSHLIALFSMSNQRYVGFSMADGKLISELLMSPTKNALFRLVSYGDGLIVLKHVASVDHFLGVEGTSLELCSKPFQWTVLRTSPRKHQQTQSLWLTNSAKDFLCGQPLKFVATTQVTTSQAKTWHLWRIGDGTSSSVLVVQWQSDVGEYGGISATQDQGVKLVRLTEAHLFDCLEIDGGLILSRHLSGSQTLYLCHQQKELHFIVGEKGLPPPDTARLSKSLPTNFEGATFVGIILNRKTNTAEIFMNDVPCAFLPFSRPSLVTSVSSIFGGRKPSVSPSKPRGADRIIVTWGAKRGAIVWNASLWQTGSKDLSVLPSPWRRPVLRTLIGPPSNYLSELPLRNLLSSDVSFPWKVGEGAVSSQGLRLAGGLPLGATSSFPQPIGSWTWSAEILVTPDQSFPATILRLYHADLCLIPLDGHTAKLQLRFGNRVTKFISDALHLGARKRHGAFDKMMVRHAESGLFLSYDSSLGCLTMSRKFQGLPSQLWHVLEMEDGGVALRQCGQGGYLAFDNVSPKLESTPEQQFYLVPSGSNHVRIQSKKDSKCLVANGPSLIIQAPEDMKGQQGNWEILRSETIDDWLVHLESVAYPSLFLGQSEGQTRLESMSAEGGWVMVPDDYRSAVENAHVSLMLWAKEGGNQQFLQSATSLTRDNTRDDSWFTKKVWEDGSISLQSISSGKWLAAGPGKGIFWEESHSNLTHWKLHYTMQSDWAQVGAVAKSSTGITPSSIDIIYQGKIVYTFGTEDLASLVMKQQIYTETTELWFRNVAFWPFPLEAADLADLEVHPDRAGVLSNLADKVSSVTATCSVLGKSWGPTTMRTAVDDDEGNTVSKVEGKGGIELITPSRDKLLNFVGGAVTLPSLWNDFDTSVDAFNHMVQVLLENPKNGDEVAINVHRHLLAFCAGESKRRCKFCGKREDEHFRCAICSFDVCRACMVHYLKRGNCENILIKDDGRKPKKKSLSRRVNVSAEAFTFLVDVCLTVLPPAGTDLVLLDGFPDVKLLTNSSGALGWQNRFQEAPVFSWNLPPGIGELRIGEWVRLAIRLEAGATYKIYVNGMLILQDRDTVVEGDFTVLAEAQKSDKAKTVVRQEETKQHKMVTIGDNVNPGIRSPGGKQDVSIVSNSQAGKLDLVRQQLDDGVDPNSLDEYGETGLHETARKGHPEVARLLLERKADPTIQAHRNNGWQPLHIAAQYGKTAVAKVLIEFGAPVNGLAHVPDTPSSAGDTSLCIAARSAHTDTLEFLLSVPDSNPWMTGNKGKNAFEDAKTSEIKEMVTKLSQREGKEPAFANASNFATCEVTINGIKEVKLAREVYVIMETRPPQPGGPQQSQAGPATSFRHTFSVPLNTQAGLAQSVKLRLMDNSGMVKDKSHPHILELCQKVYDGEYSCDTCHSHGSGPAYHCDACNWDVHPACFVDSGQVCFGYAFIPLAMLQERVMTVNWSLMECLGGRGMVEVHTEFKKNDVSSPVQDVQDDEKILLTLPESLKLFPQGAEGALIGQAELLLDPDFSMETQGLLCRRDVVSKKFCPPFPSFVPEDARRWLANLIARWQFSEKSDSHSNIQAAMAISQNDLFKACHLLRTRPQYIEEITAKWELMTLPEELGIPEAAAVLSAEADRASVPTKAGLGLLLDYVCSSERPPKLHGFEKAIVPQSQPVTESKIVLPKLFWKENTLLLLTGPEDGPKKSDRSVLNSVRDLSVDRALMLWLYVESDLARRFCSRALRQLLVLSVEAERLDNLGKHIGLVFRHLSRFGDLEDAASLRGLVIKVLNRAVLNEQSAWTAPVNSLVVEILHQMLFLVNRSDDITPDSRVWNGDFRAVVWLLATFAQFLASPPAGCRPLSLTKLAERLFPPFVLNLLVRLVCEHKYHDEYVRLALASVLAYSLYVLLGISKRRPLLQPSEIHGLTKFISMMPAPSESRPVSPLTLSLLEALLTVHVSVTEMDSEDGMFFNNAPAWSTLVIKAFALVSSMAEPKLREGKGNKELSLPRDFLLQVLSTIKKDHSDAITTLPQEVGPETSPSYQLAKSRLAGKAITDEAILQELQLNALDEIQSAVVPADSDLVNLVRNMAEAKGVASIIPKELSPTPMQISHFPLLERLPPFALRFRFEVLANYNVLHEESKFLKYVDMTLPTGTSILTDRQRTTRNILLWSTKMKWWSAEVKSTVVDTPQYQLTLNRFKAHNQRFDAEGKSSLFGQAFHQMKREIGIFKRCSNGRAWKVAYIGEHSNDHGGPYRQSLQEFCADLQSSVLPLFIPSPNQRGNVGSYREKWLPNPAANSPMHLAMFDFIGRLIGLAMRTGDFLPLDLPSLIWKSLLHEEITSEDLLSIDVLSFKICEQLDALVTASDIDRELFAELADTTFQIVGVDGKAVHPLMPGSEDLKVTWDNKDLYKELFQSFRIHEFDTQIAALRQGLLKVVPPSYLLFSWQELELLVCGRKAVDFENWRLNTRYEGCSGSDRHCSFFWECVKSRMDDEERAKLLRFVWGRSRLPLGTWPEKFTICRHEASRGKSQDVIDTFLPEAHTCFFKLDLPSYSSIDIMHQKLIFAITHCLSTDGDATYHPGDVTIA